MISSAGSAGQMSAPQQAGAGHVVVLSQLAADEDWSARFLPDAAAFSGWNPRRPGDRAAGVR